MPVQTKNLPTLELLNSLLELDNSSPTGLRWKISRSNRVKVGDPAGTKHNQGYWQISITTDKKELYLCHRIVHYMRTGTDPVNKFIDHITNQRENNSQLRLCLSRDNTRNRKKDEAEGKTSSSFKGVSWDSRNKKWKAQICVDYKATNLGRFLSEKEAAQAYNLAAIEFFGEFAWLNKIT
jgi:hypothetical protein